MLPNTYDLNEAFNKKRAPSAGISSTSDTKRSELLIYQALGALYFDD
jgi:hypothetical protein